MHRLVHLAMKVWDYGTKNRRQKGLRFGILVGYSAQISGRSERLSEGTYHMCYVY